MEGKDLRAGPRARRGRFLVAGVVSRLWLFLQQWRSGNTATKSDALGLFLGFVIAGIVVTALASVFARSTPSA